MESVWIIFRKLDKLWCYAHNGEPGAVVSEVCALETLHKLMGAFACHHDKEETDEYIVWKFEV